MICPCCGQEVKPKARLEALARRLSPKVQGPMLMALIKSQKPLSANDLANVVYAGRSDGGPDAANKVIHLSISKLRDHLRGTGYEINRYGLSGYQLMPVRVAQ